MQMFTMKNHKIEAYDRQILNKVKNNKVINVLRKRLAYVYVCVSKDCSLYADGKEYDN